MSERKPDTPVVHLPWSAWQDITARLDALEAAVFKSPPAPDVIERVRACLHNAVVLWGHRCTDQPQEVWLAETREALRLLGARP